MFPDATSPIFTYCPANQQLMPDANEYAVTAEWQMPTAVDNSGESPSVTCDQDSRSQFKIGYTVVRCTARDTSGNEESVHLCYQT